MAQGNVPKVRKTAAVRAKRSKKCKINAYKSYHSNLRLPVPKKINLLYISFKGSLYRFFFAITSIRLNSNYILLIKKNIFIDFLVIFI